METETRTREFKSLQDVDKVKANYPENTISINEKTVTFYDPSDDLNDELRELGLAETDYIIHCIPNRELEFSVLEGEKGSYHYETFFFSLKSYTRTRLGKTIFFIEIDDNLLKFYKYRLKTEDIELKDISRAEINSYPSEGFPGKYELLVVKDGKEEYHNFEGVID
jgi:hypothetical protein